MTRLRTQAGSAGGAGDSVAEVTARSHESMTLPAEAVAFLAEFAGRHTFQTFDDSPRKRGHLARIVHDPAELHSLNAQGAGVFLMVNEGDGRGRDNDSVTRIRAYFADFDGQPLPARWNLEPSLLVESSPGKYHAYWILQEGEAPPLDGAAFNAQQEALARHVGSCPDDCKGLSRVMRLPPFKHQKGEPYASRVLSITGTRYTLAQIQAAFPVPKKAERKPTPVQAERAPVLPSGDRVADTRRKYALEGVAREAAALASMGEDSGRNKKFNDALYVAFARVAGGHLVESDLDPIITAAYESGLPKGEIKATSRSARKGLEHPDYLERVGLDLLRPGISVGSRGSDGGEPDALPIIQTNGSQLRQQTAATLTALLAANRDAPRLFLRAGDLVRVIEGEERPEPQPLQVADVISEMTDAADFVSVKVTKDGEVIETPVRPPVQIAQDVLSRRNKTPWPRLALLASAPLFDRTGQLVIGDGYHEASGIYLHGALKLPPLPAVADALALLDEVFQDFIFHDRDAARAHILAALLTVPARLLFDGPAPLILVNGAQQGTGKSLLAEVLSLIATGGGRISTSSFPTRPEEQEKTITARLYADEPVILLDNVTHLGGEILAAALTSETWSGRYLGRSQILTLPNKALWLATGNNPRLDNEMPRRIVPVRLTADRARPEDRTDFRHPDLKRWARQQLPQIYAAVLVLVLNWQQQGSPRSSERRLGGYEDWAEVIGGILTAAGVAGFLTDREDIYQSAADGGLNEWAQLLDHLYQFAGHEYEWRVKEMVPHVEQLGLLEDITGEAKTEHSKARRLASALRDQRDRVIGAYQLKMGADRSNNSTVWQVLPAGDTAEL